ncbi:MAG: DUF45 domain-containing protein, partial [Pseudomonadota bacterium]
MNPESDRQLSLPLYPAYRQRHSRRARRMQLKVTPLGEVEVVVPSGASSLEVQRFVSDNAQWLVEALRYYDEKRQREPQLNARLQRQISLPAVAENWQVSYAGGARCRVTACRHAGELCVRSTDVRAARRALGAWLG